jgi:hypothetical protein
MKTYKRWSVFKNENAEILCKESVKPLRVDADLKYIVSNLNDKILDVAK